MLAPEDEALVLEALRYSLASDIVELVVLTADDVFLQTLREAVGVSRRLWHVPTADKVGDLLIAGGVGILVLDAQALPPEAVPVFITKIKRQFPDLVIIVAGARDSENALAALISAGTVYRFIHKPMSPGRARLFSDAAVKKYEEQRRTGGSTVIATRARTPRWMLIGRTCAALGVLTAITVGLVRHNTLQEGGAQPSPHGVAPPPPATAPADDHDQLMARAENALREQLAKSLEQRRDHAVPARPQSASAPDEAPRAAEGADASKGTAPEVQAPPQAAAQATAQDPQAAAQATAQAPPQAAEHPPVESPNEVQHPADAEPAERALKSADDRPQQARLIEPANDALAQQKPAASVLNASELTLVKSVQPAYPRRAEQKGIEGWVDLEFTVAESGAVKDIDVRAAVPSGVFEQAAVGAFSQWRYEPVVRDAKPTALRARIRIRFALAH